MDVNNFLAALRIHAATLRSEQPDQPLYLRMKKERQAIVLETTINGDSERRTSLGVGDDMQVSAIQVSTIATKLRMNAGVIHRLASELACHSKRPILRRQWPECFDLPLSKHFS